MVKYNKTKTTNNLLDIFLEHFEQELSENKNLRNYHRLINSGSNSRYLFRKAYFKQRLEFVKNSISKENSKIIDIGCGYGTTSFLLGMLGHQVTGTTLEYYFDQTSDRFKYWQKYFDTSQIDIKYENLFSTDYQEKIYDYIIVQDTLHHLEPINDALVILRRLLKDDGKIIISEENGNNIFCNLRHFKERGFKRIIEVYDEKLKTSYLMGNENTRSLKKWSELLEKNGLKILNNNYIRLFFPLYYKNKTLEEVIQKEKEISKHSKILNELFYFGLNFTASKK